jgi:hypothetical protein
MSDTDDPGGLQKTTLSVLDMREGLSLRREGAAGPATDGDHIGTTEAREEGFYWVILGQNPPEIAYWERGEWWLAGDPRPWKPEAGTVASDRLVFKPRLTPVA